MHFTWYKFYCFLSVLQIAQWLSAVYIITVLSQWNRWHLKSLESQLFTQPFMKPQSKENIKAPRHLPLWGEVSEDWWIPRTKCQQRGQCFHLMTSSCVYPSACHKIQNRLASAWWRPSFAILWHVLWLNTDVIKSLLSHQCNKNRWKHIASKPTMSSLYKPRSHIDDI